MPSRGAFIVIEGLDRSGKSTQAAKLKEKLAVDGVKVELMKFPGEYTRRYGSLQRNRRKVAYMRARITITILSFFLSHRALHLLESMRIVC